MCTTCGCGAGEIRVEGVALNGHSNIFAPVRHHPSSEHAEGHSHGHSHPHGHGHDHSHSHDHQLVLGHTHADARERGQNEDAHNGHDHNERGHSEHGHSEHGHSEHGHSEHAHSHAHSHSPTRIVQLERDILEKNNGFAQENRALFAMRGVQALNLVSSPGAGKTTLLVRTIEKLRNARPIAVIEGDQETALDAERIRATGVAALQINTGKGCHLDAHMVGHALERLPLPPGSLLLIENVGNLVCPAAFDLGEAAKVVVLSVTEGEDKPLKYPDMFRAASLMLLNKSDLLPHLSFDVGAAMAYAKRINPTLEILQISATSGEGMQEWLDWIERHRPGARVATSATPAAADSRR